RAAEALDKVVRKDDAAAYDVMIRRGIEVVEMAAYETEWNAAAVKTRERLAGRVYSKSLLAEVQAAARP
ncbi:MAG: hypothetical protein AAF997_08005, partial [Myxococcota bacterium]